jgi:signal transduction histidine kinase/CheY-like chemotaxis protein
VIAVETLTHDDGATHHSLVSEFPIRDPDGVPRAVAGVAIDITERIETEAQLRAVTAKLQEADRHKDEFLATLAHELRNPLAPIHNAVHVLRRDATQGGWEPRDHALLSMIERQVQHLVRLVDDLLEVSRITRGKIKLQKRTVDLSKTLQDALDIAAPGIDEAKHELKITLPREPLLVDGDAVRLAQVFANLLNNAAKYTEQGGRISLVAERCGDEAVVTISDSGVGISEEMLPRVFDLFTQVDRASGRAQSGLGIGLALVRRLVEMHGGTVEAKSEGLKKGSTFVVRLPLAPQKSWKDSAKGREPTKGLPVAHRVLVIDDEHDVADSLAMLLEMLGAKVEVAYSGLAGLEALQRFKPDLVFLDLGMPDLDGYQTARQIRELPEGKSAKLVALTGWGQKQIQAPAREAGFDQALTKPASFEALHDLLAE